MSDKPETPFDRDPRLLEDLDLVEWTPHAFRGEKFVRATVRLDAAGVDYTPGARYYTSTNREA